MQIAMSKLCEQVSIFNYPNYIDCLLTGCALFGQDLW